MSTVTQPPARNTTWETTLAEVLDAALARHACPGAALTAFDGDRAALVACGVADVESGAPVAHDTRFQIGSVTKPMTATLALQAVAAGELELDAEVEGFEGVTLRMLLDHTSGLSGDDYADYGDGPGAIGALVEALAARPRLYEPGAHFSYCNNGYALIGRLLERAWDAPFATLIEQRLFGPLGLATASASLLRHEPGTTAYGHVTLPGAAAPQRSAAWAFPYAGGPGGSTVTMSAMDLARFALAHCSGGSLHELGQPMRTRSSVVGDGETSAWGLGWSHSARAAGADLLGHSGETRGQQAFLYFEPEAGRVLALVTNGFSGSAVFEDLVHEAASELGWAATVPAPTPDGTPAAIAGSFARYEARFAATPQDGGLTLAHEYTGSQAAVSDVVSAVSRFEPAGAEQWWTRDAAGRPGQTLRPLVDADGEVGAARLNLRLYRRTR
jgi:CubicO group peptidase (beta-lactamase class C family)